MYSELGAELVSNALRTIAGSYISEYGFSAVTPEALRDWVVQIRERIESQADAQQSKIREYACTLLFIIASDAGTVCAQIGDGAIIIKHDSKLHVAIWPDNGEYANETFFVTHDDSQSLLHIESFGPISDFIVSSDGLQRLALNEAEKSAYPGFVNPLFATVRATNNIEGLKERLEAFLQSPRINDRTDDDKSIVIACRVE